LLLTWKAIVILIVTVLAYIVHVLFPLTVSISFLSSASLLASVERREAGISSFPAARSMAERMPTLEEQLAFLMKKEQQRTRPLTIEQQLASFIEEQQGRSSSFQRSRSIPSDRSLTIEHELASLIDQQQGRHRSFQAANSVADRIPTIDQQLALLFEQQQQSRLDVFQATSSLPERVWTVEQQLAYLTRDQQGGYSPFPAMSSLAVEGASTIQQQLLARLIREQQLDQNFPAASSINPSSPSRSNLLEEHHLSQLALLEHRQLLAQIQRDTHLQQAQAGGSSFAGLDQGYAGHALRLGSPPGTPGSRMRIPPIYGSQDSFPGNRYRILVEAERQGSDPILSLAQGAQAQQAFAASSPRNAGPDRTLSLEHLQLLSQQQHRHQRTLADTHLPAPAGLHAGGYSFDNRDHDLPTHTPSSTAATGPAILMPPPFGRHGKSESFPGKLYRLMAHVEMVRDTHIVSFTPEGRSFKIHDPDAFMRDVSPNYFHQSQFLSFVRQLNLYGFERILLGPNFGAYAHPSFIRGRPELLCNIKRKSNPAASRAKISTQASTT
jgi:hypothetical protein